MTAVNLLQLLAPSVTASYAEIHAGTAPWFVSESGTCQVYRSLVGDVNCWTMGPTEDTWEWMVDFMAEPDRVHNHPEFGPVHLGFWLDIQSAMTEIRNAMEALGWPPWYGAAHSKGNEIILMAAEFASEGHAPLALGCYEPPCVGGPPLTAFFKAKAPVTQIAWSKTMNQTGADFVTQVPEGPRWEHQGDPVMLLVDNDYGLAQKHEWPAVLAAVQARRSGG